MKTLLLAIMILPFLAKAQLRLAPIFSDHMVLQRLQPIHLWGKARPGEEVNVQFAKQVRRVIAGTDSAWTVSFDRQQANAIPQSILISCGREKIELKNILIGDLWLCLGQSNMAWPMQHELHYEEEKLRAHWPLLRFFNPHYAGKEIFNEAFPDSVLMRMNPATFYKGKWEEVDSNSLKKISAVGYYFGKEIMIHEKVPVGLMNLSMGGAPIETFISLATLREDPRFAGKTKADWLMNDALPEWARQRARENLAVHGRVPADKHGTDHPYKPGFVFEAGIKPLIPLPLKGIIWYQGESNAQELPRVNEYGELMAIMINDFRKKWKQPGMPFYYVQLSSVDTVNYKGHLWPQFRDEQRKIMDLIEPAGMAVCSDIGTRNDVHPRNKKQVGYRLARWALHTTYKKQVVPSGPLPVHALYDKGSIIIRFKYPASGLKPAEGGRLRGFSIDGKTETEAMISGKTVVINAPLKPAYIYYGWSPYSSGNLVNSELLPASTFKIPVSTSRPNDQVRESNPVSLIPRPRELEWKTGFFNLHACTTILVRRKELLPESGFLQQALAARGFKLQLTDSIVKNIPLLELDLGYTTDHSTNEAYSLQVSNTRIMLKGAGNHGIFNGIQTLIQLLNNEGKVSNCAISDWPAFSWRGYMVDVGRNFQSMALLKQQIDIMSRYKLNIFHLHLTEDIAWRLASKKYPQLVAAENMLRDKGSFYTEQDLKELVTYCRQRHITLVPEIDMPGHSAAFKRAMRTDMQSDSGLVIVKNILEEFCRTYDVPYLHIGADEVRISNKKFIPEVTALIERSGKKVIGWEPGGNFTASTIRQLWMDDNGRITADSSIRYLDSRHLYLNHMDPLESVVTIFNRRIANKDQGDQAALGAILCVWHDRAVKEERDIQAMNPVYPGMLAFAERNWLGGGEEKWLASLGRSGSERAVSFVEFENRLMDHKEKYFSGLPFPYARQSGIEWKLIGPFQNGGDLTRQFEPEKEDFNYSSLKAPVVMGGTIILRHWWAPLVQGVLEDPDDSCTWYATSRIWSNDDREEQYWIGFNNISRSPATDSPPLNKWDHRESRIWVNNRTIDPPLWKRGGQKGNAEIPLIDEGYEYRQPVRIALKKGWNRVLVRLPVGSFKGEDWQNPVKWMFTFIPAPPGSDNW